MKRFIEKDQDKKNNLPEVLITGGVLGAVVITAFLNIYLAGYLFCALSIGAGLFIAMFGRR